jgi:prepilin-type N-terminal cleavage/methylation domain-containing protein
METESREVAQRPEQAPGSRRGGFTLTELLIGVGILGVLAAIAIPAYLGFVQRARETAVVHYLRAVHKGQQEWRLETDAPGYSGDFDELEESGAIPDATNFVRARRRSARSGSSRTTSSRLVQSYRLDLTAADNPSANTYTYTLYAYPQNRSRRVRWFYVDQTGLIRAGTGWTGPSAPPIS